MDFHSVPLSAAVVDQLDMLSGALDDQGTDLQAILSVLTDDVAAAVPSFLGLSITTYIGDDEVTLITVDSSAAARTSLQLRLPVSAGEPQSEVVLYAGRPGAFLKLAADGHLAADFGGQSIVDAHLPPPVARLYSTQAFGIAELSELNQAIGVLMERGYSPASARIVLQDRAEDEGVTLAMAARQELQHLP